MNVIVRPLLFTKLSLFIKSKSGYRVSYEKGSWILFIKLSISLNRVSLNRVLGVLFTHFVTFVFLFFSGSLHALCIQCDVLSSGAKKHKKFLRWCQESLLTGHLWQLLESTHSQVAQVAVPLLMHSVGLPGNFT